MKHTVMTLTILLFFHHCVTGQKELTNISLGLSITPNMLYRTVKIDDSYNGHPTYNEIMFQEYPIFGYSIGMHLLWHKLSKIDFESGILYSQRGFAWNDEVYGVTLPVSTPFLVYNFTGKFTYNYIDIPVTINYNLFKGNFTRFYLKGGPNINFLLNSNYTVIRDDGETSETFYYHYDFNELKQHYHQRINISTILAIGTSFSFSGKYMAIVEPIANYSFHPFPRRTDYSRANFELGIRFGILRNL